MDELFLQKFRVLESLLERRYEGRRVSSSSYIVEFLHEEDSAGIRPELDLVREIRNMLTHNTLPDGSPVVTPTQGTMDILDGLIEYLSKSQYALNYGTPASRCIAIRPDAVLFDAVRRMSGSGVSVAPILDDRGAVCGVLSMRVMFDYFAESGRYDGRQMKVADLGKFTRLNRPGGDNCAFVSEKTPIDRVREMFNQYPERNHRLGLVFVTRNGAQDEPLLALLTAWDALRHIPVGTSLEDKS